MLEPLKGVNFNGKPATSSYSLSKSSGMHKSLLSFLIVFLIPLLGLGQDKFRSYLEDPGLVPREHSVDMLHLKLEAEFEPTKKLIFGRVTHTFRTLHKNVDSLSLDGPGIRIGNARLDGKNLKKRQTEKGVVFYFDTPLGWHTKHDLVIDYEANPAKGIYFIGWNDSTNRSRKQIWTQGQGKDNRHWIPCFDSPNDKITTEILVKFESRYKVLSNGVKLREVVGGDGFTYWHYKMSRPHASYLIMLGIGEYAIKEVASRKGTPINLWYYPGWEDRVEPTYRYSAEMMDFMEEEIGIDYPWESYSQIPVQDFMYGAMENTTATLYGDFFSVDKRSYLDRNYVSVNAHELAHQWFGDMVTARSGAHHWLQESFATHYNWLYEREVFGIDHYNWNRFKANQSALKAGENDDRGIGHSQAGSLRHYPKGAFVLHMLKYVVGEDEYKEAIRYYLQENAYANVDSKDLLTAFSETLGLSLDWFWDEWVYRGGEPAYDVTYEEVRKEGVGYVAFKVRQVHDTSEVVRLFKMPIAFEIWYTDGTSDKKKAWIEKRDEQVQIPLKSGKEVDFVLFDPNQQVVKKVNFPKPLNMLLAQAERAPHMLDRHAAVKALGDKEFTDKMSTFKTAFENETFHAVKGEILKQILEAKNKKGYALVRKAIKSDDVRVREDALIAADSIPDELISDYEALLEDSSYNNVQLALKKLCDANPQKASEYLEKTKDEIGTYGKNVRIRWLEESLKLSQDSLLVLELVDYTSESYEFITRVSAAQALERLNHFDEQLMVNLVDGVTSSNGRLRRPFYQVLKHFYMQEKHKEAIANYWHSGEWTDWEVSVLGKLFAER